MREKIGVIAVAAMLIAPALAWLRLVPGLAGFVAFALGGTFGVFWAFGAERMERAKRDQDELYRDLVSNAQQVRNGLIRAVRSVLPGSRRKSP